MGRSVIVVRVPSGPNPPYVHSGGRIYRRVGDSSEPKPETDRAVLDEMWRKSFASKEALRTFYHAPLREPRDWQAIQPCGRVYFVLDPSLRGKSLSLAFEDFTRVLDCRLYTPESVVLSRQHTTHNGFIASRSFRGEHPAANVLSLRWWHNGNACITIPFPFDSPMSLGDREPQTNRERFHAAFAHRKFVIPGQYTMQAPFILDVPHWALTLQAMTTLYFRLLERCDIKGKIGCKILLSGVRYCIPYLPLQSFISQIAKCDVPVVVDDLVLSPPDEAPFDSLAFWISQGQLSEGAAKRSTLLLLNALLPALGVHSVWTPGDPGETPAEFDELLQTARDMNYTRGRRSLDEAFKN